MGFTIETSVPVLTVFLQGVISFFSPCVFPLIPLYVGYFAGGAKTVDATGAIRYPRRKVMLHTFFFVLGISFAFFALGLGVTALGRFFSAGRIWFARISGVIMILFGLYQLGVFGKSGALERERRLPLRLDKLAMGPLTAFLLGFTFSFAWTPCVGPTLGSVLLMAGSSGGSVAGFALIAVYTLGFVLPFLAVGLFTGTVLDFFKRHQNVVRYTIRVGAILLILMGLMTLTGFMNGLNRSLAQTDSPETAPTQSVPPEETQPSAVPAPDFTLTDQYGNEHTLSDYRGKTVFLNFWATWCGPCQREMPEIQALYEAYGSNEEELIVLGVAAPNVGREGDADHIAAFLKEHGYTFPVVMDENAAAAFSQYGIRAFPTTFMIDTDGNVYGYLETALTGEMMEAIVTQTMEGASQPPSS